MCEKCERYRKSLEGILSLIINRASRGTVQTMVEHALGVTTHHQVVDIHTVTNLCIVFPPMDDGSPREAIRLGDSTVKVAKEAG